VYKSQQHTLHKEFILKINIMAAHEQLPAYGPIDSPERDDKPREECGVIAVYSPGGGAVEKSFFGLQALQNRGQEAAGIAMSINGGILVQKDTGTVQEAFGKHGHKLAGTQTVEWASGHVRYGTSETSNPWGAAHPLLPTEHIAMSVNGNIVNLPELIQWYSIDPTEKTDMQVVEAVFGKQMRSGMYNSTEHMLMDTLPNIKGAFSMVIQELLENGDSRMIIARDELGIRPLSAGRLANGGYMAASETTALDIADASFTHDIDPGTFEVITQAGIEKHHWSALTEEEIEEKRRICVFEHIYFANPDSKIDGVVVNSSRIKSGRELAIEHPADADLVICVPDSGRSAAYGFARASGIPQAEAFMKRRTIARTFIEPSEELRDKALRLKFNVIPEVVEGARLIVVDDSIVRGRTTRQTVQMLRDAGAAEVHLRIASPENKNPCYYGTDTGDPEELISRKMNPEELRAHLNVESLGFLSVAGIHRAVGKKACDACFTGDYPIPVSTPNGEVLITA
jgi:amidophosphoribosyltransferase